MKRLWLAITVAGLLAVAILYPWHRVATTATAQVDRTVVVERTTLQQTTIATGVIRPVVGAEINVGSRISGTVVHLPVRIGDRVEAGQLLAELDSARLEAEVDQARADVALARSRVALAEGSLERRQRLTGMDLASDESLEIAVRDAAVERARLEASQARLRSAETLLGYTQITAPIAGVIAEVSTREGETVAADFSAPTFVTIVDVDRLEVLAYIDETDIGRVSVGQTASFSVDAYPGVEFFATINAIQPKAQVQAGVVNYIARLDFEPREGCILRPEMTAHLQLLIGERRNALTVPRQALRRRDGREYVVVDRAGQRLEQSVETGWRSEHSVEILRGLEEGETIELNPT